MNMTIHCELKLLVASLAVGICLMMVYDGLRLLRTFIAHSSFWTGLEDALYWIGSSIATFLLLFSQNDGILRWYAVAGVLTGMLLYNLTVSRILLKLLKKMEKYFTIRKKKRQKRRQQNRERRQERLQKRNEERSKEALREKQEDRKTGETENAGKRKNEKKEKRKSE